MNDWSGELDKLINDNNNYNYNYNYNKCTICWSFLELPVSCCGKCCVSISCREVLGHNQEYAVKHLTTGEN